MNRTYLFPLATAALGAALLAAGCGASGIPEAPLGISAPAVVPAAAPVSSGGVTVAVKSVHDGDTFTDTAGVKYRLLVMDSCEIGTPGGARARDEARKLLPVGQVVTVTTIGKRSYDRQLAYVTLPDGRDFADVMLEADHTAVYEGKNDASPAKVAEGRTHDADGRDCGTAAKPAAATRSAAPTTTTAHRQPTRTTRTPSPGDSDYVSANDRLAAQRDPWIQGQLQDAEDHHRVVDANGETFYEYCQRTGQPTAYCKAG